MFADSLGGLGGYVPGFEYLSLNKFLLLVMIMAVLFGLIYLAIMTSRTKVDHRYHGYTDGMWVDQRVFDFVKAHLLRQNAWARESINGGRCMYRGSNGRMCAVGALLPDSLYTPTMEGSVAVNYQVREALAKVFGQERLSDYQTNFLHKLQEIHDSCSPSSWKYALNNFAEKYNLQA